MAGIERREQFRARSSCLLNVWCVETQTLLGRVANLSLGGMMLIGRDAIAESAIVRVRLEAVPASSSASEVMPLAQNALMQKPFVPASCVQDSGVQSPFEDDPPDNILPLSIHAECLWAEASGNSYWSGMQFTQLSPVAIVKIAELYSYFESRAL